MLERVELAVGFGAASCDGCVGRCKVAGCEVFTHFEPVALRCDCSGLFDATKTRSYSSITIEPIFTSAINC